MFHNRSAAVSGDPVIFKVIKKKKNQKARQADKWEAHKAEDGHPEEEIPQEDIKRLRQISS